MLHSCISFVFTYQNATISTTHIKKPLKHYTWLYDTRITFVFATRLRPHSTRSLLLLYKYCRERQNRIRRLAYCSFKFICFIDLTLYVFVSCCPISLSCVDQIVWLFFDCCRKCCSTPFGKFNFIYNSSEFRRLSSIVLCPSLITQMQTGVLITLFDYKR